MTDEFADLVMPIFRRVLELQDQLGWHESRSLDEVKQTARSWIEAARRGASHDPELARTFELGEFGLVAWIDEVLTESEWGKSVDWGSREHVLEWDIYKSHERARLFYSAAAAADDEGNLDVLEIYLLCVCWDSRAKWFITSRRLAEWVQRIYDRVAAREFPARPFPEDRVVQSPFGPLRGPGLLLTTSVLASITALLTLAAYLIAVHLDFSPP